MPTIVIERAKVVLEALEKGEREGGQSQKTMIDDLPLFAMTTPQPAKAVKASRVEEKLKEVFPDDLTPRDALALIYELKRLGET